MPNTINESKNKTILVVEDTDINFFLIEELLSHSDLQLIRVMNGLNAVNICKENSTIDLVLMDISLPCIDGVEATKQILQFRPKLPIIAVTAGDCRKRCLDAGCVDFISKPVEEEDLKSRIKKFLPN